MRRKNKQSSQNGIINKLPKGNFHYGSKIFGYLGYDPSIGSAQLEGRYRRARHTDSRGYLADREVATSIRAWHLLLSDKPSASHSTATRSSFSWAWALARWSRLGSLASDGSSLNGTNRNISGMDNARLLVGKLSDLSRFSVGLAATLFGTVVMASSASAATTLCDQYAATDIKNGYRVQNNVWNPAGGTQCITVTAKGFRVSTATNSQPTNSAPASYPSIFYGWHWGAQSPDTILPLQAGLATSIKTSVAMSYPKGAVFVAAYDIWYDTTGQTSGQNDGAEITVWLKHHDSIQPYGSQVATNVAIAGAHWDVWQGVGTNGSISWTTVYYVRRKATNYASFRPSEFYNDAVRRGFAKDSWYLTSIQAGFGIWQQGKGLKVRKFSVSGM